MYIADVFTMSCMARNRYLQAVTPCLPHMTKCRSTGYANYSLFSWYKWPPPSLYYTTGKIWLVCIKKVQSVALLLVQNEDRSPSVWKGKKGVTRLLQTLAGIVCPPSSITVGPSSISTHRQPRRGIDWSVSGLLTVDLRSAHNGSEILCSKTIE